FYSSLDENVNLLFFILISNASNYGEFFTMECFYGLSIISAAIYANAYTDKLLILKENKGKSGIYRWINKESGKSYIGSSINLSRRLLEYFNTNYLLTKSNMAICKALLKYGYSNFSLEIIEYCKPEKSVEREQHIWIFYLIFIIYYLMRSHHRASTIQKKRSQNYQQVKKEKKSNVW
uniref:hypothetical protein n=1 Tax=Drechslerella dactyloides TaxID=74499 RepID=UPI0022FD6757